MGEKTHSVYAAVLILNSAALYAANLGVNDYRVIDAAIPAPLTDVTPDPKRGREIVVDVRRGNCLACHSMPNELEEQMQGNLGPSLAGVAQRLSAGHLRLRLVDSTKINPNSIMPAYYRVNNLNRVAAEYFGRPVLNALEIEDIIAYLQMLDYRE